MKLSTTTRYGLRALTDLCVQQQDAPVSVSDIARRQNIPVNYLEQLFAKLRRSNILKSVRGAQGGYLLARPAKEITLSEVIAALGEEILFGSCQSEKGCANAATCSTFDLWNRLRISIDGILDGTTLEDLAKKDRTLRARKTVDPLRRAAVARALKHPEVRP